ncbi:MAG: lipopolysaccharide biosynthesis protein [Bacteroidales bacterium]
MNWRRILQLFQVEYFRHTVTLVSSAALAQLIGLLVYPLLTRLFTPAHFGELSVYLSVSMILSILASGRYEQAILLPRRNEHALQLLQLALFISMVTMTILFVFLLFTRNWVSSLLGVPEISHWLLTLPLYVLIMVACQTFTFYFNRHKQYNTIAAYNVTQSAASSAMRVGFGLLKTGGGGLILGSLLGYAGGLVAFLFPFLKKHKNSNILFKSTLVKKRAKEYINFPRFRMVHLFLNYFSGNLPVLLLSSWFSSSAAGIYSLGYTVVSRPVNLFLNSVERTFSQRIIEKKNNGQSLLYDFQRFVRSMFLLALVTFIPVWLAAPFVFTLVFGSAWAESATYFRIILPWMFMFFLATPLSFLPDFFMQQKKAMWIEAVQLVLRIVALTAGLLLKNPHLGMVFYSAIGVGIYGYCLWWYYSLVRQHDRQLPLSIM